MRLHKTRALARAAALAIVALGLAPLQALAAPGLCAAQEQVLFSCRIGAKQAAVCASPPLDATGGNVQYRFGRPGSWPELAYPAAGSDWRAAVRGATLTFSGGGGAVLAFERPPYRYAVYSAVGQGWGEKAGVVVDKGGRRISVLRCTGPVLSELGPDLFARAGIASLEGDFELP